MASSSASMPQTIHHSRDRDRLQRPNDGEDGPHRSGTRKHGPLRRSDLRTACHALEQTRSYRSELEACLLYSSLLLGQSCSELATSSGSGNDTGTPRLPGGVVDARDALLAACVPPPEEDEEGGPSSQQRPHGGGQLGRVCHATALACSLGRAAEVATSLKRKATTDLYETVLTADVRLSENENEPDDDDDDDADPLEPWFRHFYASLRELREFHARHDRNSSSASSEGTKAMPKYPVMPDDDDNGNAHGDHNNGDEQQRKVIEQTEARLLGRVRKRSRVGNPEADGYDLASAVTDACRDAVSQGFSGEEVLGKYLDLTTVHAYVVENGLFSLSTIKKNEKDESNNDNDNVTTESEKDQPKDKKTKNSNGDASADESPSSSLSYVEFLSRLLSGLATSVPETLKLDRRKKYVRFLRLMAEYLVSHLQKTCPLLDTDTDIIKPAMLKFEEEWKATGGMLPGWEARPQDRGALLPVEAESSSSTSLDLTPYTSPEELMEKCDAEALKAELFRLGLKCGGRPLDRAKRLYATRDKPLSELPVKWFANKNTGTVPPTVSPSAEDKSSTSDQPPPQTSKPTTWLERLSASRNLRRVDLARFEVLVTALLHQIRPTLDATARRAERRTVQTANEREREFLEEMYGSARPAMTTATTTTTTTSTTCQVIPKEKSSEANGDSNNTNDSAAVDARDEDSMDEDEEDDAPIYNPKGVPLGWDGKPIPYWLFKLHGLNHFFPCEICGNESYRGRRNFEKHFTESKHAYGMRLLGIPNTKHFHGVTVIEDALALWERLQQNMEEVAEADEEYEDSHGNVLTRTEYEDLARQGLL